ncbi:MAG: EutN/CcmL family microcompartment protein [Anaerolineales bacterium]|nr:EutN/CcmL family microcompartment protein [Anaerolineales bacterium]
MLLGRVRGTAICTIKYPDLKGMKLLVVQPLDKHLRPVGPMQVAVDVVMAGPDDLCVMVRSREAALALREHKFVPVDLALVGIVDQLDVRPDGEFDFTLKQSTTRYT